MSVNFSVQSTFHMTGRLHVAIIMDGNGRWATNRGWPRTAGHRAGANAVKRTVEAAPELGIGVLTLYAFSSDNWKRPAAEVDTLMDLFGIYLKRETARCVEQGIRVSVIGRRDRLPLALCAAIESTENATAGGKALHLRIAVDYSARSEMLDTLLRLRGSPKITRDAFNRMLAGPDPRAACVDLLIRTGGEQRLSDFLLWESAYAELCFTKVMWPDFSRADLEEAIESFRKRNRRFGGLPAASIAS